MKLHDEVDGFGMLNGDSSATQINGRGRRGSIRKSFNLPSVVEMDQDTEFADQEMERPSTSGTGVSPGSSMDDDIDLDDDGDDGGRGGAEPRLRLDRPPLRPRELLLPGRRRHRDGGSRRGHRISSDRRSWRTL